MRFTAPIIWTACIVALSLMPGGSLPSGNWLDRIHADKWVHAVMYAVLFMLYAAAFANGGVSAFNVIALSCLIAVSTGIVIELLQWTLTTDRHFDMLDIMANITGVVFSAILYRIRVI